MPLLKVLIILQVTNGLSLLASAIRGCSPVTRDINTLAGAHWLWNFSLNTLACCKGCALYAQLVARSVPSVQAHIWFITRCPLIFSLCMGDAKAVQGCGSLATKQAWDSNNNNNNNDNNMLQKAPVSLLRGTHQAVGLASGDEAADIKTPARELRASLDKSQLTLTALRSVNRAGLVPYSESVTW
eukprot:879669-Pelagomonas_calceolata.AAC.3